MLSKQELKIIRQLSQKKYRKELGKFIVEGEKMVNELIKSSVKIQRIYGLQSWKDKNSTIDCEIITNKELSQCSQLRTPNEVLAIAEIPNHRVPTASAFFLCLDDISDPGNLGTILRTAAWFGIKNVICSEKTADVYNIKAVQSTMGAIFQLNIEYTDLESWLLEIKKEKKDIRIVGAQLEGEELSNYHWPTSTCLVLGSESHGISSSIKALLDQSVIIPGGGTESLNVGIAGGILMASHFMR